MRYGHACGRVLRKLWRVLVGSARRLPEAVADGRIRGGAGRARAAVVDRKYVVSASAAPLTRIVSNGDGALILRVDRLRVAALASAVGRGERARPAAVVRPVHA